MDAFDRNRHFWAGRRVALTGATGFVGHTLAVTLHQLGARVRGLVRNPGKTKRLNRAGVPWIQGDLDDRAALAQLAEGCEFFFHLAGAVAFDGPWEQFEKVNIVGTRNALAAARNAGVRRFIHTSSIVAVGASETPQLLAENTPWNLGKYHVPYITSKRRIEEEMLSAAADVVVVNPSCVLGPDDHFRSEFGTLCRRFWRYRLPIYFGGGMNWVDVRDVAEGMLLAAQHGRRGERYLLTGTNRNWTDFFRDLAATVERSIPRVRVPTAVAAFAGWVQSCFPREKKGKPWITPEQACVAHLYMYCTSAKAHAEFGYEPRPWRVTLEDMRKYWIEIDRIQGRNAA